MSLPPLPVSSTAAPRTGAVLELALGGDPGDVAELHVVADVERDLRPHELPGRRGALDPWSGAALVTVSIGGRVLLPGAAVRADDLTRLRVLAHRPPQPEDLRLPAVILGPADAAVLAWGETRWPLPLDGRLEIPAALRPGVHALAQLRRLVLVAQGRTEELGLTLWRRADFEVPWHDVRLAPRARWWFQLAQVPDAMGYADAAASQEVPIARFLPVAASSESARRSPER